MSESGNVLEFNSNVAVLVRCDNIINTINKTRYDIENKNELGRYDAEISDLIRHFIALYKEISVELNKDEKHIYNDLKKLRERYSTKRPSREDNLTYWNKCMDEIDDLEIKLREAAKRHGFLSTNKKNVSKASMQR